MDVDVVGSSPKRTDLHSPRVVGHVVTVSGSAHSTAAQANWTKRVIPSPKRYFQVAYTFDDPAVSMDGSLLKTVGASVGSDSTNCLTFATYQITTTALTALHGQVGASALVDVVKCDAADGTAIIRVEANSAVQVRSALTLLGQFDGKACAFHVTRSSAFLSGLAVPSRELK